MRLLQEVKLFEDAGVLVRVGNRMVMNDLDVAEVVLNAWGGARQRGQLTVIWEPMIVGAENMVNPPTPGGYELLQEKED